MQYVPKFYVLTHIYVNLIDNTSFLENSVDPDQL